MEPLHKSEWENKEKHPTENTKKEDEEKLFLSKKRTYRSNKLLFVSFIS